MQNFMQTINNGDDNMVVKQELVIRDENGEFYIGGKSGIYTNTGYDMQSGNYPILKEEDNTERFFVVDLWQLGVFGSENCKATYDKENDIALVKEEDVYHYASKCIKEVTKGLEKAIAQAIIEEIKDDGGETVKLIENENARYYTKPIQIIDVEEYGEEVANEIISEQGDIDDLTTSVTYGLHDGIKSDILEFAYKYCEKQGYDLDD